MGSAGRRQQPFLMDQTCNPRCSSSETQCLHCPKWIPAAATRKLLLFNAALVYRHVHGKPVPSDFSFMHSFEYENRLAEKGQSSLPARISICNQARLVPPVFDMLLLLARTKNNNSLVNSTDFGIIFNARLPYIEGRASLLVLMRHRPEERREERNHPAGDAAAQCLLLGALKIREFDDARVWRLTPAFRIRCAGAAAAFPFLVTSNPSSPRPKSSSFPSSRKILESSVGESHSRSPHIPENFVESSELKNTNELDSFNKDVQAFHPLFPPFRQSKPKRPSKKIAKDDLEASSDIKDIKSQVDSSIKARKLLSKTDDDFNGKKIYSKVGKREYLGELVHRDKQEGEEEEDLLEWYDADFQEREENLEEEGDYRGRQVLEDSKEEKKLWSFKNCDSFAFITSEDDIDEDYTETSEPLLAHPLILPYARTPRPRYFSNDVSTENVLKSLPRRPPSPERHILPGRFDLRKEKKRFEEERKKNDVKNYVRESKNRIAQGLMEMIVNGYEVDTVISSLVLQLILEEVVFSIDFVDNDSDVHSLLTIATTVVLEELKISWLSDSTDSRFDEESKSLLSPNGPIQATCSWALARTATATGFALKRNVALSYRDTEGQFISYAQVSLHRSHGNNGNSVVSVPPRESSGLINIHGFP
ncbi:hypothetical protein V1478_006762 [Vespula squamosa]|uniref:Uncharacterized protein n=1 Tax=Vespula squamosa TaxID=30214 RepID=A0ABD2B0U9_VESSQ